MEQLMGTLNELASVRIRHPLSTSRSLEEGIYAARQRLLKRFEAIREAHPERGIDVWTQPVPLSLNGLSATSDNIVLVLPGSAIDAGVIVIGAYYDTLLGEDFFNTRAVAPGANSNGSGVAILVELARIMAKEPHRATLVFVAFTASETGRQGSSTFLKKYLEAQQPPIKPRAMINLEALGNNRRLNGAVGTDEIKIYSADPNGSASRQLARTLKLTNTAYQERESPLLTLAIQSAEERSGRFGDHQTFSGAAIPAIKLTESSEDASRLRTSADTVQRINQPYLLKAARTSLLVVSTLADSLPAPSGFTFRDEFGIPVLSWRTVPGAAAYVVALRKIDSVEIEQVFITSTPELGWGGFSRYVIGAVGAVDRSGGIGVLSEEFTLAEVERR
jgi:hypothetical protein